MRICKSILTPFFCAETLTVSVARNKSKILLEKQRNKYDTAIFNYDLRNNEYELRKIQHELREILEKLT